MENFFFGSASVRRTRLTSFLVDQGPHSWHGSTGSFKISNAPSVDHYDPWSNFGLEQKRCIDVSIVPF